MKRIITLFLAVLLLFSLVSCGGDTEGGSSAPDVASNSATPDEPTPADPDDVSMINGTLYAVVAEDEVPTRDFGYEEGKLTPERVAEALSAWTGLNFSITSEFDAEYGTYIITWKSDSSLATGQPPMEQNEEFTFYDAVTLRFFMLNSLCRTIRENIGEYDIYYAVEGGDLNEMELGVDFNPGMAYNRNESPKVLG
ncbi:MAG: hypothetical protein LBL82_00085 [Oscillospiraceae bacterium]|jgi:hypothetical protein|nr:hypothetical protein [Oscillospiraceae bacterium]